MSSVSLLRLTVGDYFNLCNWQQIPPSSDRSLPPKQAKTTSPERPIVLSALTVETFFKLCNWQLLPQLEQQDDDHQQTSVTPTSSAGSIPSLPCLTVAEFFSLCNWQSLPPEVRKIQPAPSLPTKQKPPLAEQVQAFFQSIPWEGSPIIGGLPQSSLRSPSIAPLPSEMSVNDLSKLF